MIHWKLCDKLMLEKSDQWYEHSPETILENEAHKLLWDMSIQFNRTIETRRPDIVIIDKVEKSAIIGDVAIPGDKRITEKRKKKLTIIRTSNGKSKGFGVFEKYLWYLLL